MAARVRWNVAAIGAVLLANAAVAQEPRRPGQETFISRAVFADGQLWLLSDAGVLSSIAESKDDPVEVTLPEPALDLWVEGGQPAVITCSRTGCTDWTLRSRNSNGEWNIQARVTTQGDPLVSVASTGAAATVLTRGRIIDVIEGRQSEVTLSGSLHRGAITTTLVTPTNIFVGFNAGEWGGGLQRIDRKTGAVTTIERNESGELCGGPLNTKCDPVNGIATTPWNPDCIAIAIGLVHFFPSGRIVEVCGDVVRRLYFKAYPLPTSLTHATQSPNPHPDQLRDDFCSVAFFSLTRQGDALWAIAIDGIYQIAPDGTAQMSPLPTFKRIGEFSVSFELPRFVLVITNVNRRRSVSGSVPILVPR